MFKALTGSATSWPDVALHAPLHQDERSFAQRHLERHAGQLAGGNTRVSAQLVRVHPQKH